MIFLYSNTPILDWFACVLNSNSNSNRIYIIKWHVCFYMFADVIALLLILAGSISIYGHAGTYNACDIKLTVKQTRPSKPGSPPRPAGALRECFTTIRSWSRWTRTKAPLKTCGTLRNQSQTPAGVCRHAALTSQQGSRPELSQSLTRTSRAVIIVSSSEMDKRLIQSILLWWG